MKKELHTKPSNLNLLPIIIAAGFIPLVIHEYVYNCGLAQFDWFPYYVDQQRDLFLGGKMVCIIILGVITALVLAWQMISPNQDHRFKRAFWLLFAYGLLAILSAAFSKYSHWAVTGSYEMLEPVWALLAYVLICYYSFYNIREERQVYIILRWISVGFCISAVLGVLQAFGHDPLNTAIGKKLVTNPSSWSSLDNLSFIFNKISYMTVYNPDYVILYVGLFLPFLIAMLIHKDSVWAKIFPGILTIFALICLIGAGTSSTWIALAGASLVIALILLSRNRKAFLIGGITIGILLVAGSIFFFTADSMQGLRNVIFGTVDSVTGYGVRSIHTDKDITFDYKGTVVHFTYETDEAQNTAIVHCTDANGKEIPCESTLVNGEPPYIAYICSDGNEGTYGIIPIYVDEVMGIMVRIDDIEWHFVKDNNDTYYYCTSVGKILQFPDIKKCNLFRDDAMSGRGHIWNLTLPLLPKYIFLGSGANTFIMAFPQSDYIYKNYVGIPNTFDVKPHNWYLQQWVENGMTALFCILGFYLWYMIQSIRLYRRVSFKDKLHKIGFGIFVGTVIYMIGTLANDSTINTNIAYWCMLGVGVAVNHIIMEKEPNISTV